MLTTSLGMLKRLKVQKSQRAWEDFVNLYGPLLYKWNVRAGLSVEDARDISQEVLLQVFKSLHKFERRNKGSFRSWLNQINFYKMQTFKESRKKELDSRPGNHELNKLAELVSNHSWAEDFYQDVFNQSLVLLESELGYRNWVIFQKTFLDGKRPEEVAAELKCTKRVVYIVQSRTLNKLKEIVAKFIEDSH